MKKGRANDTLSGADAEYYNALQESDDRELVCCVRFFGVLKMGDGFDHPQEAVYLPGTGLKQRFGKGTRAKE